MWNAEGFNALKLEVQKLPAAASAIIDIPEIPLSIPDIDIENFVCESMLGEINSMRRKIDNLIKAPIRIMNQIDSLYYQALRDLDRFESDIGNLLKAVNPPDLNLTELYNSFLNMQANCPFIADSGMLDGMMSAFEDIASLSEMTTEAFKNQLIDDALAQVKQHLFGVSHNAFSSTLDKFVKENVGSIADLQRKYVDMLRAAGVYELLDALYMLEQCINSMCQIADRFESTAQRYREQLGISGDPSKDKDFFDRDRVKERFDRLMRRDNAQIMQLEGGSDLIAASQTDPWAAIEHKIPALQAKISEIDSAIQKVKDPEFITLSGTGEFFDNIKTIIPIEPPAV